MKQKLILLALVFGLTIVSQSTLSLGMGNIRVYSSLDEQLRSTIELTTSPDEELQNLTVTLASSSDYKKVGLDKSFVPANILVSLDEENPNIINVTSNGPVSEPIVSLLLDVNWNNGRILREFTVLLDPAVYDVGSGDVEINQVVVKPIQEQVVDSPVAQAQVEDSTAESNDVYTNEDVAQYADDETESVTTEEPVDEPANDYSISQGDVFVNEGDTLWRIANQNKVGDLSTNQMMMAIYNNNSAAFIDNNINKIIKGSRLEMPTLEQAQAISYAEALSQVQSHHQLFSPAQQDYSSYQTEDSQEDVYEDTYSAIDYGVKLSGGDSDASDNGQTNAEVGDADEAQLSDEELFNQESEKTEMQERISALEDIVEQQQTVLEIKDDGLANLESQLDEATDNVDEVFDDMVDEVSEADDVWDAVDEEVDAIADDELSIEVAEVDLTGNDSELTDSDSDELAQSTDDMVEVDEAAEVVGTTPTQAVPQFSGVVEEESLVDTTINWVMDNLQWVLIGLGALVLLLLIPRFFRGREDEGDETNFLDDIKQKNKAEIVDDVETKMNKPLAEDFNDDDLHTDEIDDDSDDVLADLDKSIAFEDEADEVEFNFEEVDETTEVDEDEFDLDGFLNDEAKSSDNMSVTADHSATLAGADFSSGDEGNSSVTADHSETLADMDFGLDEDDDLKDLAEDLTEKGEEAIDEIEEISDSFDLDEEEVSNSTTENSTADDDFNFEDEFDFDLDEGLDEIEKAAETEVSNDVVETAESLDEEDEFDDLLDLSDDESFDIETGEGMDEEIDLGLEGLVDEGDAIDTKLDLAKAYLDMGDTEGAKNLLAEVVAEGTADQASAAKKILDGM